MSIQKMIAEMTGTKSSDWELIDGPDSGCGVDYWFRNTNTGQEAYANDDQGEITIDLMEG